MKREIPTGVMVAAIVVVVLIVAFIGYKMFGPKDVTASNMTPEQLKAMNDDKDKARREHARGAHQGGQAPSSGTPDSQTAPSGQ